jgi:hypothetical protein
MSLLWPDEAKQAMVELKNTATEARVLVKNINDIVLIVKDIIASVATALRGNQ